MILILPSLRDRFGSVLLRVSIRNSLDHSSAMFVPRTPLARLIISFCNRRLRFNRYSASRHDIALMVAKLKCCWRSEMEKDEIDDRSCSGGSRDNVVAAVVWRRRPCRPTGPSWRRSSFSQWSSPLEISVFEKTKEIDDKTTTLYCNAFFSRIFRTDTRTCRASLVVRAAESVTNVNTPWPPLLRMLLSLSLLFHTADVRQNGLGTSFRRRTGSPRGYVINTTTTDGVTHTNQRYCVITRVNAAITFFFHIST